MDIRKSLNVDLFGNLIEDDKPPQDKPREVTVLRGTIADVPRRPYTVHRVSPTEVWIIND